MHASHAGTAETAAADQPWWHGKAVGWASGTLGAALVVAAGVIWMTRDDSLGRLQRSGVIRVGYAIEAPYAFAAPDGRVTGEAPEIAGRMAREVGVARVVWHQSEFEDLIGELERGEIDVIAAGMFVTPERAQRVAFSRPTCRVDQGLLVRAGNPRGLHSYEDVVADRRVRVAVLSGSAEELLLQRLGAEAGQCVAAQDAAAGVAALETGLVDGLALSAPTVRWLARRGSSRRCEVVEPFRQPPAAVRGGGGRPAFAFRQADRRLREAWDRALEHWLRSDEHRVLVAQFGFSASEAGGHSP